MSGILFFKYYFGHKTFLYSFKSTSGHHQSFFNFRSSSRKSQRQKRSRILQYSFAEKNLTHFTNLNSLGIGDNTDKNISFAVSKNNSNNNKKNKKQNKEKTFALHHFLKAKSCIPVCIFLYIFMSVCLREKIFVPNTQ